MINIFFDNFLEFKIRFFKKPVNYNKNPVDSASGLIVSDNKVFYNIPLVLFKYRAGLK